MAVKLISPNCAATSLSGARTSRLSLCALAVCSYLSDMMNALDVEALVAE